MSAVISITITESPIQKVAGIPVTVLLTTNIPATIFYTLDGTEPSEASMVATGPIYLPTDNSSVPLKAYATDGVTTSSVVYKLYGPNIVGIRNSHDVVISDSVPIIKQDYFPYGSGEPIINVTYGNTGAPNMEYEPSENVDGLKFPESDSKSLVGKDIGKLPAYVTMIIPQRVDAKETSETNKPFFNPKALFIYQDSTEEPFDPNLTQIMRPYFSTTDPESTGDGKNLYTTGADGLRTTGVFLKSHYDATDNTLIFYYRDSANGRWIKSKAPFYHKNMIQNYGNIIFSPRPNDSSKVFKWVPSVCRILF